jgi:gliding motility-associated-like protein
MKKIIFFICFLLAFMLQTSHAQQLKRQTLASMGRVQTIAPAYPLRFSATFGSCPGCNVLHPDTPARAGYLRQGFQQPPNADQGNNPLDCRLRADFAIQPRATNICGRLFDYEFNGTATTGTTIAWNFGIGANPQTANTLNPTSVTYASAGFKVVQLTIFTDRCTTSVSRALVVMPNEISLSATASVSQVKCKNAATGSIVLAPSGGMGVRTFRWNNSATTSTISNLTAGRYQCTISDANNCQYVIDTVVRQPDSVFRVTAGIKAETCTDDKDGYIRLAPRGGTAPFRVIWADSSRVGLFRDSLKKGTYAVRILDSNACSVDTSFIIDRLCPRKLTESPYFDIISPNGDGQNDYWVLKDIEQYPNNELYIYNRWGQLVYNKNGYDNTWTGNNNDGKPLPTGAYYYVARLNNDANTIYSGSVTIVR